MFDIMFMHYANKADNNGKNWWALQFLLCMRNIKWKTRPKVKRQSKSELADHLDHATTKQALWNPHDLNLFKV